MEPKIQKKSLEILAGRCLLASRRIHRMRGWGHASRLVARWAIWVSGQRPSDNLNVRGRLK
jgi:hypothetical protein